MHCISINAETPDWVELGPLTYKLLCTLIVKLSSTPPNLAHEKLDLALYSTQSLILLLNGSNDGYENNEGKFLLDV